MQSLGTLRAVCNWRRFPRDVTSECVGALEAICVHYGLAVYETSQIRRFVVAFLHDHEKYHVSYSLTGLSTCTQV